MKVVKVTVISNGVQMEQEASDQYEKGMVQVLKELGKSLEYIQTKVTEYRRRERAYGLTHDY